MKFYLVGGAVRDGLLGLPVAERDWVVVGADEAAMREHGFVAADQTFPVFLHPETGEEYALARREVKRGEGYRGFEVYSGPDVTLEEDLRRRDLTINAMAQDEAGQVTDPYGGREDLDAGLLRHVSDAFVEDPLRVLRIARFSARLSEHGFRIAHDTHRLMCRMVESGGMRHITAERLWREMVAAMRAAQPWRFFEVLHGCSALHELIPPLAEAMGEMHAHGDRPDSQPIAALKRMAAASLDPSQRLVATLLACSKSVPEAEDLARLLRADRETGLLLKRATAGCSTYKDAEQGDVDALLALAVLWRGFDAGSDIAAPLAVCEAQSAHPVVGSYLQLALPAARAVSVAHLRRQGLAGAEIGRRLMLARRDAMQAALRDANLIT
jgi:tRNA nucleotidyltransferase (CCA-adding enzyme)